MTGTNEKGMRWWYIIMALLIFVALFSMKYIWNTYDMPVIGPKSTEWEAVADNYTWYKLSLTESYQDDKWRVRLIKVYKEIEKTVDPLDPSIDNYRFIQRATLAGEEEGSIENDVITTRSGAYAQISDTHLRGNSNYFKNLLFNRNYYGSFYSFTSKEPEGHSRAESEQAIKSELEEQYKNRSRKLGAISFDYSNLQIDLINIQNRWQIH
ncbi:hypothetical protein [Veillonella magna]|uniref:Uncharacterized protein n=1 Tax=Veillonella magna TaxID=464322 RepID=A0ABS2GDN3_9FIRM|nr:hypothetical protein [Veillonella magna]MBM6823571.1 hypothetical protein [Veillonella magna]MBM6911915.1 hypothetical protein [Veillonella magna]